MKWENIKKTEKKILIVSSIAVLLTFIIGASYAYIAYTTRQEGINVLETDCINVTMEELTNEIRLTNAYPVTDEVGSNLKPFRFKLTNTCGVGVDYNLNLEVMETENRIAAKNIAVKVDENNKSILSSNQVATPTYKESDYTAVESYTTYSGSIDPYGSITHEIRIWLDESAENDSQNGSFYSKVVIEARQNQVVFNQDLKKLAEIIETEPKYMDEFLETAEDVNKIVASQEAMELIVNSEYLQEAIKTSPNYTDEIRKKILNTTVVSEVDKYNAGLPFYLLNNGQKAGVSAFLPYVNCTASEPQLCPSSFNGGSTYHFSVSCVNSYVTIVSNSLVKMDNYKYLEIYHNHYHNYSTETGISATTYLGVGTDTSINFSKYNSETWYKTDKYTYLTTNLSGLTGDHYIKVRVKHNGGATIYNTVADIIRTMALY